MAPFEPHMLNYLRDFINPDDVVLDVGSGDGRYRDIGAKEYYSLDIWPKAQPDYLLDLDTADLPIDRFFDVILLIDVLEHLDKDRALEILQQAMGLAKRAVVVYTPLIWSENGEAYSKRDDFNYENEHIIHRCLFTTGDFSDDWERVFLPSTMDGYLGFLLKAPGKTVLVGQVCMYNEVKKGNLDRCLDNLSKYCDHIVIYDDNSTDNSVEVARTYTPHIICGPTNNQMEELKHKQLILEKSLRLGATHLFWLDCDEVLERTGTDAGLRQLCDNWPENVDAFSFRETNLWRSESYVRIDSLFDKARFVRLWKVTPGIKFKETDGVHLALYPETVKTIVEAPYSVIHYGFCDYKPMMEKIGVHNLEAEELRQVAANNWILDERACSCYKVTDEMFPTGCLPPDIWARPHSRKIEDLIPCNQIPDNPVRPLVDMRSKKEWSLLHSHKYHGDYEVIHTRNQNMWGNKNIDPVNRGSCFKFDPKNKVIFDVACGGGPFMLDCIINGSKKVIGFEIDGNLIDQVKRSFDELGVDPELYDFVDMSLPMPELPQADIVYCLAMFMHVPFWQGKRYMEWFYTSLADQGEAFIQFYQDKGLTMFWNALDSITTTRLENTIERIGFKVVDRYWYLGNTEYPVWHMYHCKKGQT